MNETIPSGIRLQQLIQSHYVEILDSEKNNDKFLHLYDIGTYWVAFERSACRLCRLFTNCEISLFRIPAHPDYVVMASVPVDEAEVYFRKHRIFHDGNHRKVLSDSVLDAENYCKWHELAVRSVLP